MNDILNGRWLRVEVFEEKKFKIKTKNMTSGIAHFVVVVIIAVKLLFIIVGN